MPEPIAVYSAAGTWATPCPSFQSLVVPAGACSGPCLASSSYTITGAPLTMTFDLDEGRGFGEPQALQVTNAGVYGSVLSPRLTTSAPYVKLSPANMGALSFNEAGLAQIMADSTLLR